MRFIALTALEDSFSRREDVREGGTLGPFTETEQLACFTHPPRQSTAKPARSLRRPSAPAAGPGRCPWC